MSEKTNRKETGNQGCQVAENKKAQEDKPENQAERQRTSDSIITGSQKYLNSAANYFASAIDCGTLMLQFKQTIVRPGIAMEEISKILPVIFRSQVRRSNPRVVEILAPLWPQVAGKPMARHSKPVAFEEGTLTLESDCASWSTEMRRMESEIRAQINQYLGVSMVRKLKVRFTAKPLSASVVLADKSTIN